MKALVSAFNQEKALVGAFSVIVQPVVEPMEHYTALSRIYPYKPPVEGMEMVDHDHSEDIAEPGVNPVLKLTILVMSVASSLVSKLQGSQSVRFFSRQVECLS